MNVSNTTHTCLNTDPCWEPLTEEANRIIMTDSITIIVLMIILIVTGVPGNSLVIIVYTKQKKKTTAVLFILYLAYVDLITLISVHPYVIYKLYNSTNQEWTYFCKFFEFGIHAGLCVSTAILLMVSIDRFIAICFPLKYFRYQNFAKHILITCCIVGVVISTPLLLFYGKREIVVEINNTLLHGYVCDVTSHYRQSLLYKLFAAGLFCCFVAMCTCLVVLYTCVARKAYIARRKINPVKIIASTTSMDDMKPQSTITNTTAIISIIDVETISTENNLNFQKFPFSSKVKDVKRKGELTVAKQTLPDKLKAAKILSLVTAVFILSWLPFFVIRINNVMVGEEQNDTKSHFENVSQSFFCHLFYINNAINPLIYAILHKHFRHACLKMFKKKS